MTLEDPSPFEPFPVLRSERIYDSPWCGLRRDILRLHDGREQEHHVFEIGDAVCVVPVFANGDVLLIGQYRHPHGRTHWEIPAGRIADGEAPLDAARRELREETGHQAERWVRLPGFFPTNGISAHYAHAFVALDVTSGGPSDLEPSEQIVPRRFPQVDVETLLDSGRIADAFAALALCYHLRGARAT